MKQTEKSQKETLAPSKNSSTKYKLVFAGSIKRQLKKIDQQYHKSLKEYIEVLAVDPYTPSSDIKDPNLPDRSSRKGDFRILFNINDDSRVITIMRIMNRKDSYKTK